MAIKFPCPHCRSTLTVPDHLAGKRGSCPKCKKVVTVPEPAGAAPAPAKAAPAPAPAPPPVDVEAEAAAHLADEPTAAEGEAKTVDFLCPNCDAPLQLDVALAGKKTSCPECRRIIRVPELEKKGKKDWRQLDARLPLGARQPEQPAPEGAWQAHTSMVSGEALVEAGVVPEKVPPRTALQKARPWVLTGLAAVVLVGGGLWGWGWWKGRATQRALAQARAFADSDASRAQVGPEGQAILHLGAGQYE